MSATTTSQRLRGAAAFIGLVLLASGCHHAAEANDANPGTDAGRLRTPVKVAPVARKTLELTLRATGRTLALEQQKVRAPFKGTLTSLRVTDGQHVHANEVIATVMSLDSEAAVSGAQSMLRAARSASDQKDAQRAVELAGRGVVQRPIRAPEAGVVVSHSADEGALVTEGEEILTIAAGDSIVFVADVLQNDIPKIHRGHPVTVQLAAMEGPLKGAVQAVLPSASAKDLTVPVRVDLPSGKTPVLVGAYGSARIQVGERLNARVVPHDALFRDDLTGEARLATVSPDQLAHWVTVKTGLDEDGLVEITSPELPDSTLVITAGQVGLPDGTAVQVTP